MKRIIPHELQQIRAQEIYEQRIAKGRNGSPEGDWETARRYLTRYPKVIRAWKRDRAIAFYQQLPRSFFRRLARSFKALIDVIGKIITFPFWLFDKLPQLFANTETRPFALDAVKTIISGASLIAAIIAAIGLFVNYQDALKDRELTQERLVTDRFTKAVGQLGNSKEEVIIGGIYSLERIAKDSPKDQWTIMEVLTAFVRTNSSIPPEIQKLEERSEEKLKAFEKLEPVNIQIQAALTVIERRTPEQDYTSDEDRKLNIKILDLSNSNLSGAKLDGADLWDADLTGANLRNADLSGAKLSGAKLSGAELIRAELIRAELIRAELWDADLTGASLRNADLSGAKLWDADLTGASLRNAKLWDAKLDGAELWDADLTGANLRGANLSGAKLRDAKLWDADLTGAELWDAKLWDADLSGAKLSGADLSGANLSGADVDGVINRSNYRIKLACFWDKAVYTDAKWNGAEQKWIAVDEKVNQERIKIIKQQKDSDPKTPPNCNRWKSSK
ncbi:MAG: pentapeptide repeat-containing protein [Waterburya sp.]